MIGMLLAAAKEKDSELERLQQSEAWCVQLQQRNEEVEAMCVHYGNQTKVQGVSYMCVHLYIICALYVILYMYHIDVCTYVYFHLITLSARVRGVTVVCLFVCLFVT